MSDSEIPSSFFIPKTKVQDWANTRKSKSIERTAKNGFTYNYSEGSMPWPDPLDQPARTILTGEGGSSPSRMKHAILGDSGQYRRLIPDELELIQMFPRGWTEGLSDGHRAFCMGNALVIGVPHAIGKVIAKKYR